VSRHRALQGHHDKESNFIQLWKLRAQDSQEMSRWLDKRDEKYLSPDIQNEVEGAICLCWVYESLESGRPRVFT